MICGLKGYGPGRGGCRRDRDISVLEPGARSHASTAQNRAPSIAASEQRSEYGDEKQALADQREGLCSCSEIGWRARIRTWNPLIQSQVLYR